MGFYTKKPDKKSGDGLALTEWNDLSNAVAGHSGLTLALNPADKVGIGHTGPNATLDVARGTADGGTAVFRGTQRYSHFNHSTNEDTYIRGGKTDSKVFINDNGGNVGIGTGKGNNLLDLGNTLGKKLAVYQNATGAAFYGFGISAGTLEFHANSEASSGPKMIVKSNGNVGIGTTTDLTEKLQVDGKVKATHFIGDGSQLTNLSVGATGLNLATTSGSKVAIGHATPNATLDVARGTADLGTAVFRGTQHASHFNYSTDENTYIRGGKTSSNVLINDSGGNVGIGTGDPGTFKLNVAGSVKAGSLNIGSNGNLIKGMIAGAVNSDGSLKAGTGFTPERVSKGKYRITFSSAFPSTPYMVATCQDANDDNTISCAPDGNSNNKMLVWIYDQSEDIEDGTFAFIAFAV